MTHHVDAIVVALVCAGVVIWPFWLAYRWREPFLYFIGLVLLYAVGRVGTFIVCALWRGGA